MPDGTVCFLLVNNFQALIQIAGFDIAFFQFRHEILDDRQIETVYLKQPNNNIRNQQRIVNSVRDSLAQFL